MKSKILICGFFFLSMLAPIRAQGTMYIVFRYDDFICDAPGSREKDTARMQIWVAEQAMDKLFEKYGLSYVIAIIPKGNGAAAGEDAEKVSFIKRAVQSGRVEIAQHGLSHVNFAGRNHRPGEFRGRSYESQLSDIAQGREILMKTFGVTGISTFVPPWNAWTGDTTQVLKKLNFRILSADRYYYYDIPEGLTVVPFTSCLNDLESMLEENAMPADGIMVVLYHPFNLVRLPETSNSYYDDSYFGIDKFESLMQKLSANPNIKVVTLEQLVKETESLSTDRYRVANSLWRMQSFWEKLLPAKWLPGAAQQGLYLSTKKYSQILRFWDRITAASVSGILAMGLLGGYFLNREASIKWCFRTGIAAVILLCFSIMAELYLLQRGYHTTAIRIIPGLFATGFIPGLLWSGSRKNLHRNIYIKANGDLDG